MRSGQLKVRASRPCLISEGHARRPPILHNPLTSVSMISIAPLIPTGMCSPSLLASHGSTYPMRRHLCMACSQLYATTDMLTVRLNCTVSVISRVSVISLKHVACIQWPRLFENRNAHSMDGTHAYLSIPAPEYQLAHYGNPVGTIEDVDEVVWPFPLPLLPSVPANHCACRSTGVLPVCMPCRAVRVRTWVRFGRSPNSLHWRLGANPSPFPCPCPSSCKKSIQRGFCIVLLFRWCRCELVVF